MVIVIKFSLSHLSTCDPFFTVNMRIMPELLIPLLNLMVQMLNRQYVEAFPFCPDADVGQ